MRRRVPSGTMPGGRLAPRGRAFREESVSERSFTAMSS
jgi:hypothetical protein